LIVSRSFTKDVIVLEELRGGIWLQRASTRRTDKHHNVELGANA